MTSEYNEWYKITWRHPKPDLEAPLNQEWYSAAQLLNLLSDLEIEGTPERVRYRRDKETPRRE
eukprot:2094199-Rhodomonas_salina.1